MTKKEEKLEVTLLTLFMISLMALCALLVTGTEGPLCTGITVLVIVTLGALALFEFWWISKTGQDLWNENLERRRTRSQSPHLLR